MDREEEMTAKCNSEILLGLIGLIREGSAKEEFIYLYG